MSSTGLATVKVEKSRNFAAIGRPLTSSYWKTMLRRSKHPWPRTPMRTCSSLGWARSSTSRQKSSCKYLGVPDDAFIELCSPSEMTLDYLARAIIAVNAQHMTRLLSDQMSTTLRFIRRLNSNNLDPELCTSSANFNNMVQITF